VIPAQPRPIACTACSGTGIVQVTGDQQRQVSSVYQTPSLYGASPSISAAPPPAANNQTVNPEDDMLNLLQQQVANLSKMIELMKSKRPGGVG